jgi:hypothetical protein
VSEAEDRYLSEISRDCEGLLGPGVEVVGVRHEYSRRGVKLVARYQLGDRAWESAATGESAVAAHAALRDQLLVDRLRLGFTVLVDRP